MENTDSSKLEKKLKVLEEEKSELKNDFYIKINSYMEEISMLRDKLSKYEDLPEMDQDRKNQPSFMAEESKVQEAS